MRAACWNAALYCEKRTIFATFSACGYDGSLGDGAPYFNVIGAAEAYMRSTFFRFLFGSNWGAGFGPCVL